MKNWKALAKAAMPDAPEVETDRITAPLNTLDEIFRPLVNDLPPDLEPDFAFSADEEDQ